mgnify:CR=1 FL=1
MRLRSLLRACAIAAVVLAVGVSASAQDFRGRINGTVSDNTGAALVEYALIIAGVALPVSLVAAFGVMWLAGFSLDNLSLMALTIGTGFIYRGALTFLPAHLQAHLGLSILGWTPEAVAGAMSSLVLLAARTDEGGSAFVVEKEPGPRSGSGLSTPHALSFVQVSG